MKKKQDSTTLPMKAARSAFLQLCVIASMFGLVACSDGKQQSSNAKQMNINTQAITVSGLSSGAYMASQFHLSHAEIVTGAGLIAAGPYNCARGDINVVFAECLGEAPEVYDDAIFSVFDSNIAPAAMLQNDKVWVFHGTLDERIHANAAAALYSQYKQWLSPQSQQESDENVVFVNNMAAAHLFPTIDKGSQCDTSESPFIGSCDFDAAGEMLGHIIGQPLDPRINNEELDSKGQLIRFVQNELSDVSGASLADEGFVYVPESCNSKSCDLHISFHGCNQAIANVDDAYARDTGINNWAATNDIIVLYPQIEKSNIMPMNPQGCWDWWGYTDENYANKDGKQIKAIYAMVNNLPAFLSQQMQTK
jgi:poly(3-hydroxybutyrate) depolymerase